MVITYMLVGLWLIIQIAMWISHYMFKDTIIVPIHIPDSYIRNGITYLINMSNKEGLVTEELRFAKVFSDIYMRI